MSLRGILLWSVAASAIGGACHAQTTGAQQPAGKEASSAAKSSATAPTLGDVIVTARRRAEKLQDVPVSVTAYQAKDLTDRHITAQVDLANNTPSLVAIQSGYPGEFGGFVIRGQGPAFNGTAGTVTYFAEAPDPYLGVDGRPGSFYDLANVQVLKGPQGTLFGKNASGGNVLFEPQRPTNAFGGYIEGQLGDYNDRQVEGAVNLPIVSDKLMLRVAGDAERRDGYTTDVGPYFPGKQYDNLNYYGFRIGLLARPFEGLESYTVYRYAQSNTNGAGTTPTALAPSALLDTYFPARDADFLAQTQRSVRKVSYDLNEFDNSYFSQVMNSTTYKITPDLSLKNIISYTRDYISYAYDYDASPLPIAGQSSPHQPTEDYDYTSEELQLQGAALDHRLKYSLGVFGDVLIGSHGAGGTFTAFGSLIPAKLWGTDRSNAAFIQGTYDFGGLSQALSGLSLTAGYRYTREYTSSGSIIAGATQPSGSASFHYGSYTVDIDYKVTPQVMVYASFRDAFKAGGFNSLVPANSPLASYPPEELAAKEFGLKSTWSLFGMKGRANIDYFLGDYTNIQRVVTQILGGLPVEITESAAAGRVNGFELEATLIPVRPLELTLSYANTDSGYSKVLTAAESILSGAPFPYTPRDKVSLAVSYHIDLPPGVGGLTLGGNVSYQSKQSIAQTNQTVFPYLPGYGQLNLRADWDHVFDRPIDLAFFMTNVTDAVNVVGQFDSYLGDGFVTRTYAPPRMFGVQVKYRFGG